MTNSSLNVADLEGSNGFVINGTNTADFLGYSVSSAGDINGDGFADLIIGAPGDFFDYSFGKTYVVFGGTNVGSNGTIDLDTLDGTNGFVLNGTTEGESLGVCVSDAGDINGDGFVDLIIGVRGPYFLPGSERNYVVFGGAYVGYSGSIDLDTLDGTNGFAINDDGGETRDFSVSGAGDINGDGIDDLIIGVPGSWIYGSYGSSYVVFGGTTVGEDGNFNISDLDGSNGFRIQGIELGDSIGNSVSSAGDINGDGIDDLIIGAFYANPNGFASGASYVVFGGSYVGYSGSIDLSTLDGSNGFAINGLAEYSFLGFSVSSAGDINGDGFADVIIGAPNPLANPNSSNPGASYVVFGGSYVGYSGSIDLSTLDGSNGFAINGLEAFDKTGNSVSSAGDINGDGFNDLIIGAPGANSNGNGSGASYVVFGGSYVGYSGSIDLSTLNGSNGFAINGIAAFDHTGRSVSSAGDINDDGFDDLIIGVPYADPNGADSGASYVVFGGAYVGYSGSIDLSTLDASNDSNGFVINGLAEYDNLGYSVSSAGDINGDGIDDLIIGAPGDYFMSADYAVKTYVVFGGTDVGTGGSFDLSSLDGTNGFFLNDSTTNRTQYVGYSVSDAGDINGDGFSDLIIGGASSYVSGGSQRSYVVFGGANVGYSGSIDLSTLDGSNGFVLIADEQTGFLFDKSGASVSGAGDINSDGFDDLIIGFPSFFIDSEVESGYSAVVFGGSNVGSDGSINLSSLDGTNGFYIQGINLYDGNDGTGKSVSSAGDVNGDGFDDLIIGAPRADLNGFNSGTSYVVFGSSYVGYSGSIDLSTLDGSNGFVINGLTASDNLGFCVSGAGDINGDGFADLIISAPEPWAEPNSSNPGASYVVFGGSYVGYSGSIDLSTLDGSNGFAIDGLAAYDKTGNSVSSAGDINGDGFDDLIIGAPGANPNGNWSGASYVVFGGAYVGYSGSIDLSTLDGTNGFAIDGIARFGQTGFSVSGAGDINGDGFADLIIGAPEAQPNGFSSGAAYVLFGGSSVGYSGSIDLSTLDSSNSINADYSTFSLSHVGNEALYGDNGIDTLSGVGANNLLPSDQTNDILYSGLGNAHPVTGEANNIVTGGTGSDRFLLRTDQAISNITNFEDGQDFLILSNGLTFGQLAIAQSNSDTLISLKSTSEVLATLTGVPANLITASDFLTS